MDTLTLTMKELRRVEVLNMLDQRQLTATQAADVLGVSERHVWRLLAKYRQAGAASVTHGNRGKAPANRVSERTRRRVVKLVQSRYPDYNHQHLSEVLADEHDITLSPSTVRRIRLEAGLGSARRRRHPKHRRRRARKAQRGMLLQVDGSQHDWLEGRGPKLVLLAAIDDATNNIEAALFREQEDAAGYFLLLQQVAQKRGLPLSLYADRHTIFQSPKRATVKQELAGEIPRSQFGRLCAELCIRVHRAHSPQAKGRVERLFGTLQDRLVKVLRQAGVCDLEHANRVLQDYLPRHNRRFAVQPAEPQVAYRSLPADFAPEQHFCFKYTRRVANDNVFSFAGNKLQLPPGPKRRTWAKVTIDLQHQMDGSLVALYQDEPFATFQPADPNAPLRVDQFSPAPGQTYQAPAPASKPKKTKSRKPHKPAPDHPWRQYGQRLSTSPP